MKQINLKARVLQVPKSKSVYTGSGNIVYISNALIGDKTGSIRIGLWNQQINIISKGDVTNTKSGEVAKFRGERQLRIGRHGSLSVGDGLYAFDFGKIRSSFLATTACSSNFTVL